MFTLSWNDETRRSESIDAVEAFLDRLHQQFSRGTPTLVNVERDGGGDSLSIGLGRELSVLNHVCGDKNPPYYTSLGGSDVEETVAFLFGGEWSEYPMKNAVPISVARSAMRKFCETGELTTDLRWEQV